MSCASVMCKAIYSKIKTRFRYTYECVRRKECVAPHIYNLGIISSRVVCFVVSKKKGVRNII